MPMSKIILSNRGKLSAGHLARGIVGGVLFAAIGVYILIASEKLDFDDRYMQYLVLGAGAVLLVVGIFVLFKAVSEQRSFLELTSAGVRGAAIANPNAWTVAPPRQFSLPYSEIQRADYEKGYILLVAGTVTYRCRSGGLEEKFLRELNRRIGKPD